MNSEREQECPAEPRRKAMDAVRDNDTCLAGEALRSGIPVNLEDGTGNTLLMLACREGAPDVARFLLERGADTERRDRRGRTAIALAASKGDIGMVRLLVSYGADPLADQGRGRLPVDCAMLSGCGEAVSFLQSVSGSAKCKWRPVAAGLVGRLRALLSALCRKNFFFVAGA